MARFFIDRPIFAWVIAILMMLAGVPWAISSLYLTEARVRHRNVATVVITTALADLQSGASCASLDTGERISPGQLRRLCCGAGLIPAVLGGASQPLDVGRERRLHTKAMRVALHVRDGGCTAQDCDLPVSRCQAHHDPSWSQGGNTNVKDARLLCWRHHRYAHDPHFEQRHQPGGKISFHRRA